MIEGTRSLRITMVLRVVAIALAAVAIASAVAWGQTTSLLATGADLQQTATAYVLAMNRQVEVFKGDAASASSATPVLSVSRDAFDSLRGRVASFPAPAGSSEYRDALNAYLIAARDYYGTIADTSDFVLERARAVSGVLQSLQLLSDRNVGSEAEMRSRVMSSALLASSAGDRLRNLDASVAALYSADALIEWLGELESDLRRLDTGLAQRNAIAVTNSSQRLGALVRSDWDGLFFEADRARVGQLETQRDAVGAAQESLAAMRNQALHQQKAYGFLALSAAVAAAVLATVAWLR